MFAKLTWGVEQVTALERILISAAKRPWNTLGRIAFGFVLPPLLAAISGGRDDTWLYPIVFLGVLFVVRLVPALLRHVLPFSSEAKKIWQAKRALAKDYDSYQWQKLFWIGCGMTTYYLVAGAPPGWAGALVTVLCLSGGLAGLIVWRTIESASGKS